jgi:hypothetical protein
MTPTATREQVISLGDGSCRANPGQSVMVTTEAIDSRHYRFAFVANSAADVPADFGALAAPKGFRSALFLPGDDAGWFDRPQYPPRIILLYDDALEIRAHPSSGEATAQIILRELQFLELGHILLQGWLRFGTPGWNREFRYNTRSTPPVRRFLRSLRGAFVGPDSKPVSKSADFGSPLDLKFRNGCADELMHGERVRALFFEPSERRLSKFGPFKREVSSPADLVCVTDRRVLWLTDRHRDRYAPYGMITRFAPFRVISGLSCVRSQAGLVLLVRLRSGFEWRVPVLDELEDEARAFVQSAEFLP